MMRLIHFEGNASCLFTLAMWNIYRWQLWKSGVAFYLAHYIHLLTGLLQFTTEFSENIQNNRTTALFIIVRRHKKMSIDCLICVLL